MKRTLEERMGRIHQSIEEARQPIVLPRFNPSSRNTPLDEELRAMLLRIHEDGPITQVIAAETRNVLGHYVVLYDPHPEDDINRYLGWGARQGNIQYAILRDGGLHNQGELVPFEQHQGRFYAEREELLEHFPNLTPDKLEACVRKAVGRYLEDKKKTLYR